MRDITSLTGIPTNVIGLTAVLPFTIICLFSCSAYMVSDANADADNILSKGCNPHIVDDPINLPILQYAVTMRTSPPHLRKTLTLHIREVFSRNNAYPSPLHVFLEGIIGGDCALGDMAAYLQSPDNNIRRSAAWIIGTLSRHSRTVIVARDMTIERVVVPPIITDNAYTLLTNRLTSECNEDVLLEIINSLALHDEHRNVIDMAMERAYQETHNELNKLRMLAFLVNSPVEETFTNTVIRIFENSVLSNDILVLRSLLGIWSYCDDTLKYNPFASKCRLYGKTYIDNLAKSDDVVVRIRASKILLELYGKCEALIEIARGLCPDDKDFVLEKERCDHNKLEITREELINECYNIIKESLGGIWHGFPSEMWGEYNVKDVLQKPLLEWLTINVHRLKYKSRHEGVIIDGDK